MIPLKRLAQISFYFTSPNKINRKEFWLGFIYPAILGLLFTMFPFLIWETAFFLVVIDLLPEEIMIIVNFIVKLLAFLAFMTPILYTYMIVSIKRLRDLGHSGLWWLINLVPVVAAYIVSYLGGDAFGLLIYSLSAVMFLFILYVGFTKSKVTIDNSSGLI